MPKIRDTKTRSKTTNTVTGSKHKGTKTRHDNNVLWPSESSCDIGNAIIYFIYHKLKKKETEYKKCDAYVHKTGRMTT